MTMGEEPQSPPRLGDSALERSGAQTSGTEATSPVIASWLTELLGPDRRISQEALEERIAVGPLVLGNYEVRGWIGRGGMGTVLKGYDQNLHREVAIKLVGCNANAESLARFRREARALARLEHPGIVRIYDFEEQEGVPYFVMEFVRGGSLAERLKTSGEIYEEDAWHVLEQVAAAMVHGQSHGVLHRDIKPANLLVETTGDETGLKGGVRVCDFGVARLEAVESSLAGDTTRIAGSVPYMSPEQRRGEPVDARSDMYSLGVSVYQLLTASFPGTDRTEAARPESETGLRRRRPELSVGLAKVISKLTEAQRRDRPFNWSMVEQLVSEHRRPTGDTALASLAEGGTRSIELETVAAGEYWIGHEGEDATALERPRVLVSLPSFQISPQLFRVGQLTALLKAYPQDPVLLQWREGPLALTLTEPDAPLTWATWAEAEHIADLSGGRLPTHVEWETFALLSQQRGKDAGRGLYEWQEWCNDWVEDGYHERLAREQRTSAEDLSAAAQVRAIVDPRPCPTTKQLKVVVGSGVQSAYPRRPSWHLGYPTDVRRADLGFRVVLKKPRA
jgi:serine/threonine protein kinase